METQRTRKLALREEGARHPFRLSLPREILHVAVEPIDLVEPAPQPKFWQTEDIQLFVFSFIAFFTAFYLFIF